MLSDNFNFTTSQPDSSSDSDAEWGSYSCVYPDDFNFPASGSSSESDVDWTSCPSPLWSEDAVCIDGTTEIDEEDGASTTAVASDALDPMTESAMWQKESVVGGRGYIRSAKRFAGMILPVAVVVSLAVNILVALHSQSDEKDGSPPTDDFSQPPISVHCGRSIEDYMVDIDLACCGGAEDDHPDARCSVGSWTPKSMDGFSTQVWYEHNLYVCTDSCAKLVLPLWSQCIRPELLDMYGSIEESPAWLFKPVVAKCSQPTERRTKCEDDDSIIDLFSHTFIEPKQGRQHQLSHPPNSLCAELRDGQIECDDLLTDRGKHSVEYPEGWYDDTCCRSCPVYWPRAIIADLESSAVNHHEASHNPELPKSKIDFQALVEAVEQQEQAVANLTVPLMS